MEKVCYNRQSMISSLRDLEEIVLSLDRIGSHSNCAEEAKENLHAFAIEWNLLEKLSQLRLFLSDEFSPELGEDDMCELERAMLNLKLWQP